MNKNGAAGFPYPKRGLAVMFVFLALAPPVQVVIAALAEHKFSFDRRILFEIGAVLRERALPFLLLGYSLYIPPVFLAAVWQAWRAARGLAVTMSGAILSMLLFGLACEAVYQIAVVTAGGAWRADMLLLGMLQWIVSAFFCWCVCARFGLDKPVKKHI